MAPPVPAARIVNSTGSGDVLSVCMMLLLWGLHRDDTTAARAAGRAARSWTTYCAAARSRTRSGSAHTGMDSGQKLACIISSSDGTSAIAASATSPWWVADNATGFATIYDGTGAKIPLEVMVPGDPDGTVHNDSGSFQLQSGKPATFIFASEDGTFSAWNQW